MKNKLSALFTRVNEIYQQEGFFSLLGRIFTSLTSFANSSFYVYEVTLQKRNEADFIPKINDFTWKIVETNQQLDELLNQGFDLSLLNITGAHERLARGAILTLIFIERELAYRGWLAMTEEAKNTFNRYPYKVDFSNNEACSGDAWVNPKFRGQGIYQYAIYKDREYRIAKGIQKTRLIMLTSNITSQKAFSKIEGSRIYAKARYLRIGRLQFWKEKPIESTENSN